jgi:O-antigen/teichoic acid export membrane protein
MTMPISAPRHRCGDAAVSPLPTAPHGELKQRSVRGGLAAMLGQAAAFLLQMASTVVLARLLSPGDFGLQGMVFALTGLLNLFRDAGLGVASVQRNALTHEQASTLFWINVVVGAGLALVAALVAPVLAAFYREPRLTLMTLASATAFVFSGLAVQHRALLSRAMRFVTIAKIDLMSLGASTGVGIGMALGGFGYWSLVGMAVSGPLAGAAAVWIVMPWRPGWPGRTAGLRSMLHMGGTVTLNSLVVYMAYNTEKILLGRFWGIEALGIYGRAFQLASLPVQQINGSMSAVAFPALSRVQGDSERLYRSFLKGYSVVLSMTVPVAIIYALFAEEIVGVLLGPRWHSAAPVLRLLSPTVLALAIINPFGWLLQATGRAGRSLSIALLIAPTVIVGIAVGLGHGIAGVALGYSTAMVLLIAPVVAWAMRGTGMAAGDYWRSIAPALVSGVAAGLAGWILKRGLDDALAPMPLLIAGVSLCLGVYAWVLLIAMRQKPLYVDLSRQVFLRGAL